MRHKHCRCEPQPTYTILQWRKMSLPQQSENNDESLFSPYIPIQCSSTHLLAYLYQRSMSNLRLSKSTKFTDISKNLVTGILLFKDLILVDVPL